MTISNGDVLKCFLELVLNDGTIAQNVFHFQADFTNDQTDSAVSAAVQSYIEDIYGELAAYLEDDFTINPSWLQRVSWDATGSKWAVDYLVDIFTPSFTHAQTTDPFPNQIAPVLTANTYLPGTRGRKFLMGFVEAAANGSELLTAAVTACTAALNHYIADETISSGNDLLVGVPRSEYGTFQLFTDGVANSIVGTMRTRKPGVGA